MAVAEVAKINIIGHQQDQADILEVLQNVGFTELIDNPDQELKRQNINDQLAQIDYQLAGARFALDWLANFETKKKSLSEKIDSKINLDLAEVQTTIKNFDYQTEVKKVQDIEAGINNANVLTDKLQIELGQIEPWQKLDFVPNHQKLETNFDFRLIIAAENNFADLLTALQSRLPLSQVEKVDTNKTEILAVLFFKIGSESQLNEILNELNIKVAEFPNLEVSVSNRIKEINHQLEQSRQQIEELTVQAQTFANSQRELKIVFDYLTWQKEKIENQQKALQTDQTFSLIGWIDKKLIARLETELNKVSPNFVVEELPINEDESVPIIFKNTWAKSFEFVTNVYGAPQYGEPDPTPWLTPFFILFFGLCLTDAGYGIILALASWLGLKFLKPSGEMKKMFKVLFWGGLVTFFAGAAVGGWFGIVIDNISYAPLRDLLMAVRLIDPVKDPLTMLVFSLILGIIQVIIGIIVSMWWKIKHHNVQSALLDDGLWLYFIFAVLIGGAAKLGLIQFAYSKYLVWAGVIALITTQGRHQKNPIMKLSSGVISLYGLVGYLSDVLSYSRLLALGLATGIIAMVVNLIAGLTVDMVPYLGWVIAFFIIIGGHVFNLGINALGAFIHSSRLQFVEFFPKFMEGGGVLFQPFRKDSKYIRIINKDNQ